ncbi:MAG TPA: hypothetical protein VKR06_19425 [Ktedonosporobacter sp.]|nr:hypothetical protein [Ktedonosporobacter sp.]
MVLAVDPIIEMWGEIAAIVLCLFLLISLLLMLAFNMAILYTTAWIREKSELIKLLRPHVDSLNKTTEAAAHGVAPSEDENVIVRTVAQVPLSVQAVDQKVEAASDRVANVVVEFRARTMQAKTIAKAFLLPGLMKPRPSKDGVERGLQFKSPGYRKLIEERPSEIPVAGADGDRYRKTVAASQHREDAPAR